MMAKGGIHDHVSQVRFRQVLFYYHYWVHGLCPLSNIPNRAHLKKWICWHCHIIGWGMQLLSWVFYKMLISVTRPPLRRTNLNHWTSVRKTQS
jgi:hypothetical protein